MAKVPDSRITTLNFRAGVDNRSHETKVGRGFARKAVDVDIDVDGTVTTREGYELLATLPGAHSLWTHELLSFSLVADAGHLYVLADDGSFSSIAARTGAEVFYTMQAGRVFWSDGQTTGCVHSDASAAPWGVPSPLPSFFLSAMASGGLDAGTYGVALTHVDAYGEESGADAPIYVDVPAGGGISVYGMSPPALGATVTKTRAYRTGANGTELLAAAEFAATAGDGVLGAQQLGRALTTRLLGVFPPAAYLLEKSGRIFGAVGRYLIWSEAMYPGLSNLSHNSLAFPDEIVMIVAPASDQFLLFVGTRTATYVLAGSSIADVKRTQVSQYGCIPGAVAMTPADALNLDGVTAPVPVWVDGSGVPQAGTEHGLVPLHKQFAYPLYDKAAAIFVRDSGRSRVIVSGREDRMSALVATDSVVATVYNNGGDA